MAITYIMEDVQLEMSQTNYFFVLTGFRVKRAEGETNQKWANTTGYLIPALGVCICQATLGILTVRYTVWQAVRLVGY